MAQGNPLPGEKYLHFKNKLYQVIAVAKHSETMEPYVVYQALYGDFGVYIRPYDMFVSEVDHEKYPEVTQKYRFAYVDHTKNETLRTERAEHKKMPVNQNVEQQENVPDVTAAVSTAELQEQNMIQRESDVEEQINPWLLRFLDTDTMEEKYQIVCDIKNDITDRLIDDLAVAVDVVIPEGKLSDRYEQLKYCIRTRQKYEQTSLWRK
ncbi:DUF1653 domain-containing protein [Eubacterium ramulus]|uniref:DUF1653 domain-containing protein n=1 Tax=Eubacterium ramulus TaxID=39490 RepID=UPI00101FE899|nr:DUF1653 domain-containing protein [Eubacterium ramulus]MSC76893.1 DUF1653 domain-containing protein [Eubacterium ramulus]MSC93326.1 DUF1653 domain-containing protein [Eubacterium ramulus]RYS99140.1 DUF1653 domain-containing protein [Eubacterium ramulus]